MNLKESVLESFAAIEADNGNMAVTLFPQLGAKLGSLLDLRTGRQWLWRSDRIALARHTYGVSYVERADSGGWDECFPTVAPCTYPCGSRRGARLPDHGDLWSRAWTTKVEQDVRGVRIHGRCQAVAMPCDFSRTITLPAQGTHLEMRYEVHNTGLEDLVFIWSAHPLLCMQPGMRLAFPPNTRFNLYSAIPSTQLPQQRNLEWPFTIRNSHREIVLDPLPNRDAGVAFKIWSDPLDEGWAALIAADGALRLRFDVGEIPQIALWLNAGGWSGIGPPAYYNLALEPCIGAQDSLEEAVLKYQRYALLRTGETRRWTLHVDLEA